MQAIECIRDSGGGAPESRDDVTIVHGVLRLDARSQTQACQPWNIALLKHLRMFYGTMRMRAFRTVEHDGVRLVANGMTGDIETMLRSQTHIRFNLFRRIAERTERFRRHARIWCGAIGGTSVERTVRNHFHRTDMPKPVTARKFTAGMPAVIDGLLESFGIYASLDTQTIKPLRESANPRVDVLRHLIVAHADHAFARSVVFGVAQQMHQLIGRTRSFVQLAVGVEPLKLADESGFVHIYAKLARGGRVHPTAMHVGT